MSEMPKAYEHAEIEQRWYPIWEERGWFEAADSSDKPPFCIMIPPPNVTGSLHMGHGLTNTIQDILVRWKRMQGFNTLWQPGMDHAGIATQMVVERELRKEGVSRFDLGREAFVEKIWEWKDVYHARITKQLKALGVSMDWKRERFTMDEGLSVAVRKVFVDLHKDGLIYRAKRMVNWSPGIHTVLSNLEVDTIETKGHLWHFTYPVTGSDEKLVVATTRPETMLGDTAVAVHPDDPRYQHLIGKTIDLPLTDRTIPIVADDILVDMAFGSGAVKVTPAHDFNDFEVGQRHDLPMITILDKDAKLNENVPKTYRGLDRKAARKRIVADLDALGLLVKIDDHTLQLGHCQRTGAIVEPMLSDQWFVDVAPLAKPAIAAVKDGRTTFTSKEWERTYFHWMENIRDWCISRQLWWGHRIPAWYCDACDHITVEEETPSTCGGCGSSAIRQDEDVLDTWFSSGLWPFTTLGWPDETEALKTFYPTAVMETGFDILFFWVARMMMLGLRFMGDVPFKTVYLHPMVRDEKGDKMSKTKGNVIDPLDLVESHGADALRFTLASMVAQGRDLRLSVDRVAGYRSFANKIWNATRFALMNIPEGHTPAPMNLDDLGALSAADRWMLGKLDLAIEAVTKSLDEYHLQEAAGAVYGFFWHAFCDWYIELTKATFRGDDEAAAERSRQVLLHVLDGALRLLHPFMPFITEEIWTKLPIERPTESIMLAPWPTTNARRRDEAATARLDLEIAIIGAVRTIRGENVIPHKAQATVVIGTPDEATAVLVRTFAADLAQLANVGDLSAEVNAARPRRSAVSVASGCTVYIPLEGLVDIPKEIERLNKAILKVGKEHEKLTKKLGNERFISNAPAEVVAENRARLDDIAGMVATYKESLALLSE